MHLKTVGNAGAGVMEGGWGVAAKPQYVASLVVIYTMG